MPSGVEMGATGSLAGAGGGLMYSLVGGDDRDTWKDHLRRSLVGAGLGGAAGLGIGAMSDSAEGSAAPKRRSMADPAVVGGRDTGRMVGSGLVSGLLSRAYGGGPASLLFNAGAGGVIGGSDLKPAQRAAARAAQGGFMGLLTPGSLLNAPGATHGAGLSGRLMNMGRSAVFNTVLGELGERMGGSVGTAVAANGA